jgi:GDP-L-fucose synthase
MSNLTNRSILITGGNGFLGRAVRRALQSRGVYACCPSSHDCDLRFQSVASGYFQFHCPEIVIHLAAIVGGIGANRERPAHFFCENILIGMNVAELCRRYRVQKLINIGTACSYPADAPTPIEESSMWSGYPEPTNAPYGVAKRAMITMLDAYRDQYGLESVTLIPANLYGPGDNFDPETSHVIPAMIRKIEESKKTGVPPVFWGNGNATRQFLYVDDAAEAIVRAAERDVGETVVNLPGKDEVIMRDLVWEVGAACGYRCGDELWDSTMPNGQRRRALCGKRASDWLNWSPSTTLATGLANTVEWWRRQMAPAIH